MAERLRRLCCQDIPLSLPSQTQSHGKALAQWLWTYLPMWLRWAGGCRTFWWWYRWTAEWWVSCQAGGCSFETPAWGALDGGPDLSSRWLCFSPSNGQTPWAGEMSNTPQLTTTALKPKSTQPSIQASLLKWENGYNFNMYPVMLWSAVSNHLQPTNIYWVLLSSQEYWTR